MKLCVITHWNAAYGTFFSNITLSTLYQIYKYKEMSADAYLPHCSVIEFKLMGKSTEDAI